MKKLKTLAIVMAALMVVACGSEEKKESGIAIIPAENFQKNIGGKEVVLMTIKNNNGLTAQITNYGARLVSLWVPDKDGKFIDVVQGQNTIDSYMNAYELYYGATVGRYANRIANGQFTLDGEEYQLDINDGENHLHGGSKGFFTVVWDAEQVSDNTVRLAYRAMDGEMGYPGNLDVVLNYSLDDDNTLRITYEAETDKPTIVNLSHHSYFNLSGAGKETINDHMLKLYASNFTPTDENLIPTGEIWTVYDTPMDFTEFHAIGDRVEEDYEPLVIAGGYDHNWVLDQADGVKVAAEIYSPESGILMTVYTDEPGIQFYGGNFINGTDRTKDGNGTHGFRSAFCLETQNFPDAPNHENFPSAVLRPGEKYERVCYYAFGIKK
ncbi:MAG: galactose mutarotase [Rikenellaceae bacterium]|nr:galactose mutarotase [Rikenellaceae bacterium]